MWPRVSCASSYMELAPSSSSTAPRAKRPMYNKTRPAYLTHPTSARVTASHPPESRNPPLHRHSHLRLCRRTFVFAAALLTSTLWSVFLPSAPPHNQLTPRVG